MSKLARQDRVLNLLSCLILFSVLAPECWVFFQSKVFVFVNGWDEETYLSWQGVLGAKNIPGYFVSYLNFYLHKLGISGALQNLIFDTIFFPITVFFVFLSFRELSFGEGRAFSYALLVCLSSVLFNYANPIVGNVLGAYDGRAWLMAGHEYYPSILRTPNPQVSYFCVALAVYFFLKFRRPWVLICPLPVLYYYVAVPYVLVLAFLFVHVWSAKLRYSSSSVNVAALFSIVFLFFASGLALLFYLSGLYEESNYLRQNQQFFYQTRKLQFPLVLLFFGCVFCVLFMFKAMRSDRKLILFLGFIGLASLASVNIQLITGFMLSQKNYYDYGLSVLFGLMLVVIIELLKNNKIRFFSLVIFLFFVFYLSFQSQRNYADHALEMGRGVEGVLGEAKKDPLHAIIPDLAVSSLVAYSTPMLLAPPFSYLYYFSFIEKQCIYYESLLANAMDYAEKYLIDNPAQLAFVSGTFGTIKKWKAESLTAPYVVQSYCQPELYSGTDFFVVSVP